MNVCHRVVDELVDLAFSGAEVEAVMERATLMLRVVLESGPEVPAQALDGFRPELLDRTTPAAPPAERPAGGFDGVATPVVFNAGREVGRALGQALQGKIDRTQLRTTLRALLCR